MRLLDLFCGAGGAAMGYHRAGFDEIIGIDIEPQPNYPFTFIQADIATDDVVDPEQFDLIHASPPCQVHSDLKTMLAEDHRHRDLVQVTRDMLIEYDRPYVIENVPGAPLHNPIQLCGSRLATRLIEGTPATGNVFELRRHRLFEPSFPLWGLECRHWNDAQVLGVYGDLAKNRRPSNRGVKAGVRDAEIMMGIDWMTPKELVQAIPPAYTEYIGRAFLDLA